ncbi:hypothetical protein J6590_065234 [Homalodisca vitripennis]|nr:hypothetical protein J6590_065234 [Homalodisca vitripennis]
MAGQVNASQDAIIEQLVDDPNDLTQTDVNDWFTGEEEEQLCQIMTDDAIVANILDSGDDDEGERGTDCVAAAPQTVNTDQALRAFTTAIIWAEENSASASELLTLKGLQEKVLKHSLMLKNKNYRRLFSCL